MLKSLLLHHQSLQYIKCYPHSTYLDEDVDLTNLCQRLLQAQQGRVLSFAMETVFVVFYLSIFLYYLLEVYFILIDILYELYPLLVGQLTHEKILICLIFSHFSAIFAQITIFLKCTQTMSTVLYLLFFPHFCNTLQCPPLLIFWLQCVSYHIWKCTQTM